MKNNSTTHYSPSSSFEEYDRTIRLKSLEENSQNNSTKSSKASSLKDNGKIQTDSFELNEEGFPDFSSHITLLTNRYENNGSSLGNLYEIINSEPFSMEGLIVYLNDRHEQGIIDTIVNLIHERYVHESFFYIPQLCALIAYKDYFESIENYLLESCIDKIKFSMIIYWIASANSNHVKMEELLNRIEMTLVNGRRATFSTFNSFIWQKAQTEYEIIQQSINKESRLNYFNMAMHFYEDIKFLCESLIGVHKDDQGNHLKSEINRFNKAIKNLYLQLEDMSVTEEDPIRNMSRGLLLPFDDYETVNDSDNNLIVSFIPELSLCFNTKARVPVKLTVECIRVYESEKWDSLYCNCQNEETNDTDNTTVNINDDGDINIIKFDSVDDFLNQICFQDIENNIKAQQEINKKEINNILQTIKEANDNPKKEANPIKTIKTKEQKNHLDQNNQLICDFTPETISLFGNKWDDVVMEQKEKSSFKNFESYSLKSFIAKSNDDLRQEALAMQLIKKFDSILRKAEIPLRLCPYEILVTSSTSGLIEFLPNTVSIDVLKKSLPVDWTLSIFYRKFFKDYFEEAQKNFAESLAAYSLLTYLLDIKDRHNGNILIDIYGNIIHIDFGFILGISPGNLSFEKAPFKFTSEYIEILDGVSSNIFQYFRTLLIRGMIELRNNYESISQIIEIIAKGEQNLPCFSGRNIKDIMNSLKAKFRFDKSEIEVVDDLIYYSANNWRTIQYDNFQKYTNDIRP